MPAARSDARNTATSAIVNQPGCPAQRGHPGDHLHYRPRLWRVRATDLGEFLLGQRLGDTRGPDAADADAAGSHLGRQVPHERLRCCVGWSGAAHTRHRPGPRRAVEMQDHAGALLDHASPRGARGTEVAAQAVDHGPQEVVSRNLDQRVPWTSPRLMRLNDTYTEKPLWSPAAYRQLDSVGKLNTHEHIRR